jgi:hypothetical protein
MSNGDTAGSWDWWGSLGGTLGKSTVKDQTRKVLTYRAYFLSGRTDLMKEWEAKNPKLKKQIVAGKWAHIFPEALARPASLPSAPKPTRLGDLPLRSPVDKLAPIGAAMRKIPLGALAGRFLGPAGLAITAASLVPKEWMTGAFRVARFLPGPVGNMARVIPAVAGNIVQRFTPQSPRPEIQPISVTARRILPPIPSVVVTAKRKPIPTSSSSSSSSTGGVVVPWWQTVLKAVGPSVLTALKPKPDDGVRIRITNSPFAESPPQPDPGGLPIPGPLTPLEGGSAECDCPPKKPRKPRQPRDECRTGRFIERTSGIQKYQTRKVPCRASRKKLQ